MKENIWDKTRMNYKYMYVHNTYVRDLRSNIYDKNKYEIKTNYYY